MPASGFKYRAFISYSHADEAWAKWLHQRLERYRIPSRLVGKVGHHGAVPRRIGRCFRDQAELSAASHLGETLQQALRESQALIIVCSPRSATSHWVNEEIKYFRFLGRGDFIYALIVDGEPNAKDSAQECLPPSLRYDEQGRLHHPLAADAREGRDGKTNGFLKLTASLVGVAFDELRRREQRRRARLMFATVGASLGIAAITTTLAIAAYRARNEAAEQRQEADDLITFMLGDLKERLEPVGRLDVLDAVTAKVLGYVARGDASAFDDVRLAQQIRTLDAIGQIRSLRHQRQSVRQLADQELVLARQLIQRAPAKPEAAYLLALALAQSGYARSLDGDNDGASAAFREARSLITGLRSAKPQDSDFLVLDALLRYRTADQYLYRGQFDKAATEYGVAADLLAALARQPGATSVLASAYWRYRGSQATILYEAGHVKDAVGVSLQIIQEAPRVIDERRNDSRTQVQIAYALISACRTFYDAGHSEWLEKNAALAADIARGLATRDPTDMNARMALGFAAYWSMRANVLAGRWEGAYAASEEGVRAFSSALTDGPNEVRSGLARTHLERAEIVLHLGRGLQRALAEYESAASLYADGESQYFSVAARLGAWESALRWDPSRAPALRVAALQAFDRFEKTAKARGSSAATALT